MPAKTVTAHTQRVQERQRAEIERRRREEEHIGECNTQKARDVEALTKRRQAAYADHKKCLADWVKPGMFSKETSDEACAGKAKDYQQASIAVKAREAKSCAPGEVRRPMI